MKKLLLSCIFLFGTCCAYVSDFTHGPDGWKGDFADYPVGEEEFYELGWGWGNLPLSFHSFTKGLYIKGNNHSDDLFMFFKKKIVGLEPNTRYTVFFSLWIETNIPPQTFGIGGSPGESIYFKVGGSAEEPKKIVENGFYLLDVDKANQGQEGKNAKIVGNLANENVDPEAPTYMPKSLSGSLPVMTDSQGSLWLFFGTDSGFEGFTQYYIAQVQVEFE
jgi:hypothetical protein